MSLVISGFIFKALQVFLACIPFYSYGVGKGMYSKMSCCLIVGWEVVIFLENAVLIDKSFFIIFIFLNVNKLTQMVFLRGRKGVFAQVHNFSYIFIYFILLNFFSCYTEYLLNRICKSIFFIIYCRFYPITLYYYDTYQ